MRLVAIEPGEKLRPPWLAPGGAVAFPLDGSVSDGLGGTVLAHIVDGAERYPAIVETEGRIRFLFDVNAVIETILNEDYFEPKRPVHTHVPLPYQWVPGEMRLRIFRWLVQSSPLEPDAGGFPEWPIDRAVETLRWMARRAAGDETRASPWPAGKQAAFTVSHDVDTADGLRLAPGVAAFEASLGVRSCWFVVGDVARSRPALIDALRAQGHEIGLHGDRHDNTLAYQKPAEMARRLASCAEIVRRHDMRGFRSPSLLETRSLREILRDSFTYASQVPDTEVRSLIGPRRGCSTCLPFLRHGLLEIPVTLPLDDKLVLDGLNEDELLSFWRQKAAAICEMGGVIQLVVHNEAHLLRRCRRAYETLVRELATDASLWTTTLGEIAERSRVELTVPTVDSSDPMRLGNAR